MKVGGTAMRSIWLEPDGWSVGIIDQTRLPHALVTDRLTTLGEAGKAIRAMRVRGAPLIGATAAYGICLALRDGASDAALDAACAILAATRPTAINLRWALDDMRRSLAALPPSGGWPPPISALPRSATRTSPSTMRSARMAPPSSAKRRSARGAARRSTC